MDKDFNSFSHVNHEIKDPVAFGALTKEQLNNELAKGMLDIEEGRVYSSEEVETEMNTQLKNV